MVNAVTSSVHQAVNVAKILPVSEIVSEVANMVALSGVMGGVPGVIRGAVMAWLIRKPDLGARHSQGLRYA